MDLETALEELDQSIKRSDLSVRLSVNHRFLDDAPEQTREAIEQENIQLEEKLKALDT